MPLMPLAIRTKSTSVQLLADRRIQALYRFPFAMQERRFFGKQD